MKRWRYTIRIAIPNEITVEYNANLLNSRGSTLVTSMANETTGAAISKVIVRTI